MTICCLPFISLLYIDKYHQTVESCSSATDENLTQHVQSSQGFGCFEEFFQTNKRTSFHSSKKKSPTYLNFQWIDFHIRSAVHGTINFILNNIQQCVVFIFVRPLQSHHHLAESTWAVISQLIMKIKHTCNKPSWLMHTQQLVYTWAINNTDMKTLTLNSLTWKR